MTYESAMQINPFWFLCRFIMSSIVHCVHCHRSLSNWKCLIPHMRVHAANRVLKCSMKECKWMGQSFSAFKNHFSFCHHFKATIFVNDKPDFVSVCLISNCGALFLSRERCLQHSRNHFTTKSFEESIPCPFLRCEYTFFSKGAFKTHV
jgi:hypothetical protein